MMVDRQHEGTTRDAQLEYALQRKVGCLAWLVAVVTVCAAIFAGAGCN